MAAVLAATAAVATGIIITRVGPHNISGQIQEDLERAMTPPGPVEKKFDAAARATGDLARAAGAAVGECATAAGDGAVALSEAAKAHVAAAAGSVQSAAQPSQQHHA